MSTPLINTGQPTLYIIIIIIIIIIILHGIYFCDLYNSQAVEGFRFYVLGLITSFTKKHIRIEKSQ